jgi:hypothetical protein
VLTRVFLRVLLALQHSFLLVVLHMIVSGLVVHLSIHQSEPFESEFCFSFRVRWLASSIACLKLCRTVSRFLGMLYVVS